jgi:CBS domain-containing protein
MRDLDLGALPIGKHDKLIGMVTDRDIAIRGAANGGNMSKTKVENVMSEHISYCYDDDDVSVAADRMGQEQIRRLVVLNHDKRAIGMITIGDIAVKGDHQLSGDVLDKVCASA